ncbi:MAG: methionyl-tRNA formyltransferase [Parvibaculales bacterium]
MRIIFMGTPEFSVAALKALHKAGHEICAVYTRPPAKKGRGMSLQPSAVGACGETMGLPVYFPTSLKSEDVQAEFAAHQADLAVVVAYGMILPQAVLDIPTLGCWNIHASLLPRWRGAAPIQRAIMAGDVQTGISIMQMEAGLDTGPVLLTKTMDIDIDDTALTLHDKLMFLGARGIVDAVGKARSLTPVPQPAFGVTYAEKIDKSEARIDWSCPADEVVRHIHGLSPFPGAWTQINDMRLKILRVSHVTGQADLSPGTVLDDSPTIACGEGLVRIEVVQRAGKPVTAAADFQRGAGLKTGDVLA